MDRRFSEGGTHEETLRPQDLKKELGTGESTIGRQWRLRSQELTHGRQ